MLARLAGPLVLAGLLSAAPSVALAQIKLAVMPTQFDATSKGKVPSLFDDYLLTAVQNDSSGIFEVIGQDDIAQLLGFDKQKQMLDCSDTSCIASLGGALGVDRILVMKVAHLGEDWVATGKVINIKETKVESRVNEIVPGDVRKLLEGVPMIVRKLMGPVIEASKDERTPAAKPAAAASSGSSSSSHEDEGGDGEAAEHHEAPAGGPPPAAVSKGGGGVPLWIPIVTSALGVSVLIGGMAMGAVAAERNACSQSGYCAGGQLAGGEANDSALLANVLYVTGGLITVTGGILFFFIRTGGGDTQTALAPIVSHDRFGLALSGRF